MLRVKIRSPRDFYGGLVLVALAVIAVWAASDLSGMQGFSFGPGTAPRLFAGLLAAAGGIITIVGLLMDGPALERYAIRGPLFVVVAILTFAVTIRPLGLVPATYVTFVIALMGSREMRWLETLIGAAVMTAFCVGLFTYLLRLPFQLFPWG